jgi:hypothetical protein
MFKVKAVFLAQLHSSWSLKTIIVKHCDYLEEGREREK